MDESKKIVKFENNPLGEKSVGEILVSWKTAELMSEYHDKVWGVVSIEEIKRVEQSIFRSFWNEILMILSLSKFSIQEASGTIEAMNKLRIQSNSVLNSET